MTQFKPGDRVRRIGARNTSPRPERKTVHIGDVFTVATVRNGDVYDEQGMMHLDQFLELAPELTPAGQRTDVSKHTRAAIDMVNHPPHYTSDPSGVECIQVTRHRNFNIGNAIKYLWRAGLKSDASLTDNSKEVEDLKKAVWYIQDEITRLSATIAEQETK